MITAKQYGPWAFIAGGSKGVAASFARQLAPALARTSCCPPEAVELVLTDRVQDLLLKACSSMSRSPDERRPTGPDSGRPDGRC